MSDMLAVPVQIDVVVDCINPEKEIPESILELATKYNVLVKQPTGDPIPLMDLIERKRAVNE